MVGRDGGKQKPLKQPKKAEKDVSAEDIEFKKKMVCYSLLSVGVKYIGWWKEENRRCSEGFDEKVVLIQVLIVLFFS